MVAALFVVTLRIRTSVGGAQCLPVFRFLPALSLYVFDLDTDDKGGLTLKCKRLENGDGGGGGRAADELNRKTKCLHKE